MKSLPQAVLALALGLFALACSQPDSSPPQGPACAADADCDGGHCDPRNGCVACLFDSHCGPAERCSGGQCHVPTSCDADADCAGGAFPICDPASLQCVRCLSDEQCGDSAHCRSGSCERYQRCGSEKDCSDGTHCDLGSGECVACLTRGDCAADNECVRGECRPTCRVEADCSATQSHCAAGGYCTECADDSHCPAVYHCQAGACARDVCAEGTTSCAEDLASLATCSERGDSLSVRACQAGQTCVTNAGVSACQSWVCSPNGVRCGASGTTVETCSADGLRVERTDECEEGDRCVAGRCATLSCEPNAGFCRDGASYLCNADGTERTLTRACAQNEHCDSSNGKCVANSCEPGSKTCRDHDSGTCRADGSGIDYEPCGAKEACVDGACREVTCVAPASFCDGPDIVACNSSGTGTVVEQTCSSACVSGFFGAYCEESSCTPGTELCVGNLATVCEGDGSGPAPGGVDCSSIGGYCEAGLCKPYFCTPNARSCREQYQYQCGSDGKSEYLSSGYACDSYYWSYSRCNPSTGLCQQPACAANTKFCSNGKVMSCDATGFVATQEENCAASGEICVAGSCVTKQCDAGTYFCKDGNPYSCADGVNSTLQAFCGESQYCKEGYGTCQTDNCEAGKPTCNGNAVSTCASDGSGPTTAGTSCGANQACVEGACKPVTCTPHQLLCLNGHVQACDATGTSASLYEYCVAESYCDALSLSCQADVCLAGKPYCDGETFATCKADGSGSVGAGTACNATSKVCTFAGCAETALDVVGTTGTVSTLYGISDYLLGNVLKVTQRRKLTKLEMSLAVSGGPVSAHWLVYSSTDGVTYYQVSDTPASLPNTADAWVSSGPLNLTLEAELYYWVGIEVAPSSGARVSYHQESRPPPALTFAQPEGIASRSASGPPASFKPDKASGSFYARLTTTLP